MKKAKGFTLIELLIVIGIIAILASIIFVAVDPARRLAEARNAERWSSVNAILNAVLQYTVDQRGTLPPALTSGVAANTGTFVIGTSGSGCDTTCTATTTPAACVDLTANLVPTYLSSIPKDPANGITAANTDYYIYRSGAGRIQVGACDSESIAGTAPTISVAR